MAEGMIMIHDDDGEVYQTSREGTYSEVLAYLTNACHTAMACDMEQRFNEMSEEEQLKHIERISQFGGRVIR